MGKAIIRKGRDASAGHGCFPPTKPTQGSNNVKVNRIGAVRMGDMYQPHKCRKVVHAGRQAQSPSTVKVNGRKVHRKGDGISCGDKGSNGSPNVFAGG